MIKNRTIKIANFKLANNFKIILKKVSKQFIQNKLLNLIEVRMILKLINKKLMN